MKAIPFFVVLLAGSVLSLAGEPVALFNGKDLAGWKADLKDPAVTMDQVWSVVDGAIVCKGKPTGVLRTEKEFSNFEIVLEYRWAPGTQGGNSGLLLFCSTPRQLEMWPKCLEVQLMTGNAGDFYQMGETVTVPDQAARQKDRRIANLTEKSEKPHGEWNTVKVRAEGGRVTVWVNGEKVNESLSCTATKGAICLQSEGAEIHFRKVELTPL